MNLLSPWFLAGAALIAGPIIFHMIRRATKDRVSFSATRFLRESPPRLERKSRIQNPWLLALRCLVVLLLAIAFARPFFQGEVPILPAAAPPQSLVIVADNSASMRREGAWIAATQAILEQARALESQDRLALVTASQPPRTLVSFERWREWPPNERLALFETVLADLEPNWQATRLDEGVDVAIAELDQLENDLSQDSSRRIALISDFQKSARIAGLAGREWPEGCDLELIAVEGTSSGNVGLRLLGWSEGENDSRSLRIGLQASGVLESSERRLSLRDASTSEPIGEPVSLYLNSGDSPIARLPVPNDRSGPFEVRLEGDREGFDDTLYAVSEQPRPLAIDYQGDPLVLDDPNRAAFYLRKATLGWEDPRIEFDSERENAPNQGSASTFIVIDSELDVPSAEATRQRIDSGSHALFLLSSPSQANVLAALLDEPNWSAQPIDRSDSRLGTIDFQHPNFDLFADPRFSDFSRIRFWHDFALTEPSDTQAVALARYDDGAPAVLEATIGKGQLTVWVGDWAPDHSQWALSSKFVPWLQRLFERAVGGPEQPDAFELDGLAKAVVLQGSRWQGLEEATFSEAVPERPGVYRLQGQRVERWIAINPPSVESEWETRPVEDWERMGAPLVGSAASQNASTQPDEAQTRLENAFELESQQQLWRWLIIVVAIVLAIESLIARRLQNRGEEGIAA